MEFKELNLEFKFDLNARKKYSFYNLFVPENVERMEIKIIYDRYIFTNDQSAKEEFARIDFAIYDNFGDFRGSSSKRINEIFIEENNATVGYVRGKIGKGNWKIMIGTRLITRDDTRVNLNIKFFYKQRVMLKGDLHIHSTMSDGDLSVPEIFSMAKKLKLDFIFLTDHNTTLQNDYIPMEDELIVFPGIELTNYKGHCNFLNYNKHPKFMFYSKKDELISNIREAREAGAIVCINHPFQKSRWEWGFDIDYDVLEIQNKHYKPRDEDQTIAFWHNELCMDKKIPIVGGSDFHGTRFLQSISSPCTVVYSESHQREDILKAIKSGNSFVTCFVDGPTINMRVGEYMLGDTVPKNYKSSVSINFKKLMPLDEIIIYSDKGIHLTATAPEEKQPKYTLSIERTDEKFFRAEVWRNHLIGAKILVLISNPIYWSN